MANSITNKVMLKVDRFRSVQ